MKRQRTHADQDDGDGSNSKIKVRNPTADTRSQPRHDRSFYLSVDARKYDGPFPNFRKPAEVGSFSQDSKRVFHHDRRQLRAFVKPREADPGFDLRRGYGSLIQKDDNVKERLDDMLRWVMNNAAKFSLHSETGHSSIDSLHTDVVCWRGLLTKVLCTPYEQQDDWLIAVTRWRGTYFLCEFETDRKRRQQEQMTPRQREMSYWGWKFEQYVTAEQEGGTPDTDRPVNNNEGFCSVVRSRLRSHSLVYGGEVDCYDISIPGDNKYVELKTSRIIEAPRQRTNFKRFKLLKWWAQSFLLGIPKIISGFRDDEGIVHELQDFYTQDIPGLAEDVPNGWRPNVCFNFLDHFLTFIKQSVTTDHPQQVYLVHWSPGQDIEMTSVSDPSPYTFLPPWFVNWEGWTVK